MIVKEIAPLSVAERGCLLGRADNVSEENRAEHGVGRDWRLRAGQELANGVSDLNFCRGDTG